MPLYQALRIILICNLLLGATAAYGQQNLGASRGSSDAEVLFYLPINKLQFPTLVQELELALSNASVNNTGLSKLTITTTDYWHHYQQGIRKGRPGVYFAAPHFAAWLVNKHQFEPVLRLAGNLQYVIVSRRSDSHIFEAGDLANKTVCTNAMMDISFLVVRESMSRSVLAADTLRVQNVAKEMNSDNKKCDAFSLSEHLFLPFATEDPFQFIRLQQSKEFSNYAYLLHPNIPSELKKPLKKFLSSKEASDILAPMYRLFAKEPRILNGKPSNYPRSQAISLEPYWGKLPKTSKPATTP